MILKTLTVTLALIAAPGLGIAAGCSHDRQALSCAEGTVYDAASGTCVTSTNS